MQERHGAWPNATAETVADDDIRAAPKLQDEPHQVAEIVGVVGVTHDQVPAACGVASARQSGAVSTLIHSNDSRAERFGDVDGAIVAAVVSDDDLAADSLGEKKLDALVIHEPSDSASLRHGITIDSSSSPSPGG